MLDGDFRIIDGSAGETLQRADGVLEIRDFLGFGGLSEISALDAESNERAVMKGLVKTGLLVYRTRLHRAGKRLTESDDWRFHL